MNLKARVKKLERLQYPRPDDGITIAVLDRVVNGTISEEEFARHMPFWEEVLGNSEMPADATLITQ
jgi:hypothetical protein